ncbi:MAG: DUF5777 family beta-barrel protein [Bacteroidota bacterium]
MNRLITSLLLLFIFSASVSAQERIQETFKTFRIINGQSVETLWANNLMFTIGHRFGGTLDQGIDELFGMDAYADVRLGLAYGINYDLTVGIGRNRFRKIYDGFVKYKILHQKENGFPFSASIFTSTAIRTEEWPDDIVDELSFNHKLSYTAQLIMASKLSEKFSIQLSPTLVYRNLAREVADENDTWAVGIGLRYKISDSVALLFENYQRLNANDLPNRYNPIGIGIDFTSERHSFQIQFSNANSLIDQQFIPETNDDFFDGGIHIGFNITRRFAL